MKIERITHKSTNPEGITHDIYEVVVDGKSIRLFSELSDDYALVNANELIEDQAALAKTRGENPTIAYN